MHEQTDLRILSYRIRFRTSSATCRLDYVCVRQLSSLEQFNKLLKTHLFKISFAQLTVCDCKALLKRLVLPAVLYKLSKLHYITL